MSVYKHTEVMECVKNHELSRWITREALRFLNKIDQIGRFSNLN